jgi:hypothetical protein
LAKSLTQCRANLERSIQAFEVQLAGEKSAASQAVETLNELLQERQRREERQVDPLCGPMVPALVM